jgi:hypothetical protein
MFLVNFQSVLQLQSSMNGQSSWVVLSKIESHLLTREKPARNFQLARGGFPLDPPQQHQNICIIDKSMDRKEYKKNWQKEAKKRKKYVNVSFSKDEYDYIKKIADKEGEKVTPFIKALALAQAGKIDYIPKEKQDKLNEFVFMIRNIANNVNQIAKHSNTIKSLKNENGLLAYLKDLETKIKEFVRNDN